MQRRHLALFALLAISLSVCQGQAPALAPAPAAPAAASGGSGFFDRLKQAGSTVAGAVTSAADKVADAATGAAQSVRDKFAGPGAPGPLAAAPSPRPSPVMRETSNLVFSLTGASATFTNETLTIAGASPAVSFFTTVPVWHAGVLNTTFFTSQSLVYNTTWLGDPDAALYGTDQATGRKVVVLLTIGEPVMKGEKVTFAAYHLPSTAAPLLQNGIVDGIVQGIRAGTYAGPNVLASPSSTTQLQNVALVVDNALQEFPQPAGLKAAAVDPAVDDSGFTYDCRANTVWKPIWCGAGGFYGGFGYFG